MEELHSILKGCTSNNAKQQKLLYERYYGYAFKVVFRYIFHYEQVADVVNDGFVKVFRNFNSFACIEVANAEKCLLGWIKKIMVNTAIDELRKNHMMPEIGGIPDSAWETEKGTENADQQLLYKELISLVKKLPPAYRAVFNMYVIDGYAHHEIAELMHISVGTSKSNLFKAKAFLQNLINKDRQRQGYATFE